MWNAPRWLQRGGCSTRFLPSLSMDDTATEQEILASTSPVSAANTTPNSGAFFPHGRHFIISGGTFTSNVTHLAPTELHRFRVIPLGDLDLLQEIRLEDVSSVVKAKLYYVLVSRRKSKMTAAVYRGRSGEEEWRHELQTYSGIRHPNIVQIYGVVSSPGLHATIFHDGSYFVILLGASLRVYLFSAVLGVQGRLRPSSYSWNYPVGRGIHCLDTEADGRARN
ncbi:hypothetical protein K438DRAFT_252003 [Mycena galopus ATCC 62051]|nr:hypothetical protein K438DRAFT_252003 [Mycena galopus ATCC 62051]